MCVQNLSTLDWLCVERQWGRICFLVLFICWCAKQFLWIKWRFIPALSSRFCQSLICYWPLYYSFWVSNTLEKVNSPCSLTNNACHSLLLFVLWCTSGVPPYQMTVSLHTHCYLLCPLWDSSGGVILMMRGYCRCFVSPSQWWMVSGPVHHTPQKKRRIAGLQYYLQTLPGASWEKIAGVLWRMEEHTALEEVRQHLHPYGQWVVLSLCHSLGFVPISLGFHVCGPVTLLIFLRT